jgi:hypothetical membrane protein
MQKDLRNQAARWLVLVGGVVNPVGFVVAYTIGGLLRAGYSPIHQAISDLGVGTNGEVLDAIGVVHGLLLIAFGIGFALIMRSALSRGWLVLSTALLVLRGLVFIVVAIFTEAPATVAIHSLGSIVGLITMMSALIVIGLALRRNSAWRGWGNYTLVVALVTLVLVAIEFWVFTPGTALAPARLGGLMERVVSVETLAWYVAFGWGLFVFAGPHQAVQSPSFSRDTAPRPSRRGTSARHDM